MKKRITISVLLLVGVVLAHAGNDLTLSYTKLKNSRVIRALVDTDEVVYSFSVRQDRDGSFSLEAPPFLTAETDDMIRIGEIRDSGLFTLMLSPMEHGIRRHGFNKGGNFQKINSPTLRPRMSGIIFSFEHIDLISLSPVFNPQSPLGFGVLAGNRNVFLGFLISGQNEMTLASAARKYQVNWAHLGTGRRMVFSIAGVSARAETQSWSIDGQLFVQNAWDRYLGGGTTTGWDVEAVSDLISISGSRKIGGTGVKLKRLTDDESPMDSLRLEADISSGGNLPAKLKLQYRSDTFAVPVYGGNSQKRELGFAVTAGYGAFSISSDNRILYDTDRGKIACTDYGISFEHNGMKIQADFTLNRPDGLPPKAVDGEIRISAPHAKLSITGGKTTLEMSWERTVDDITFRASVNQDRLFTASLRFTGL